MRCDVPQHGRGFREKAQCQFASADGRPRQARRSRAGRSVDYPDGQGVRRLMMFPEEDADAFAATATVDGGRRPCRRERQRDSAGSGQSSGSGAAENAGLERSTYADQFASIDIPYRAAHWGDAARQAQRPDDPCIRGSPAQQRRSPAMVEGEAVPRIAARRCSGAGLGDTATPYATCAAAGGAARSIRPSSGSTADERSESTFRPVRRSRSSSAA